MIFYYANTNTYTNITTTTTTTNNNNNNNSLIIRIFCGSTENQKCQTIQNRMILRNNKIEWSKESE